MKKHIFMLLFLSTILSAKAQNTNEQQKVNETITKLFDGIAKLDFAAIKLHTTKNMVLVEEGKVWNIDSLIRFLEPLKNLNFKRTNEITFNQTEIKGNTAWLVYHNTAHMTINGQARNINWLESAVLVKESGAWKVELLHSTTLPPK